MSQIEFPTAYYYFYYHHHYHHCSTSVDPAGVPTVVPTVQLALMRIDADTYEGAMDALRHAYPLTPSLTLYSKLTSGYAPNHPCTSTPNPLILLLP